ncbi:MAG: hypothetical protein FP816_18835 [Desulfobacteraceae bacterium]|nr:hypothetical protein [Desulfobacteraceae bacterium]MBU4055667.1 DUF2846 domain-containing protein [Pseudomonadota bacterium]
MKTKIVVLLAVIFLIAGVAIAGTIETLQKLTEGYQLPAEPKEGNAMIYVLRPSSDLMGENLNIYHDNGTGETYKGAIKASDYLYFEVPAGKHCVISENTNKKALCFKVEAKETIFVQQNLSAAKTGEVEGMSIIDPLLGKYYVSVARSHKLSQQ